MDLPLIIIGLALLGALFYVIYLLRGGTQDQSQKLMLELMQSLQKSVHESDEKSQKTIQERFDKITEHLNKQQHRSFETIQKQFGQSAKIIEDVTKKLTKLDETNKQVVTFAEQMKSLENILKNPKQRGILGEYFLESMLSAILAPGLYKMQYKFNNGEIVDAVIFMNEMIIPIDSKFSLEKFNEMTQENDPERRERLEKEFRSDVKKRIDETAKYVRPDEKTMDFAFMYIPAEGVYHNLLGNTVGTTVNTQNLIEYAFSKKVIIVSPSSFVAYLQTVLQGLKQMTMEENVKEIQKNVILLGKHLRSHEEKLHKMGGHLETTVSMYNQSYKEFKKIDKDVHRITDGEAGGEVEEILTLDKPVRDS